MKHLWVVRVPDWGFDCCEAGYYRAHWSAHIGPWLVFIWEMNDARYTAWCNANFPGALR